MTIKAGVVGWPVSHSLSPRLHGFWLEQMGINGTYEALPVEPEQFAVKVKDLFDQGYKGFNITIPHKENALTFADVLEPQARIIGAVNTLVKKEDGTIIGSNTDWIGFLNNVKEFQPNWKASDGPCVVLGAGGAARGLVVALIEDGASEIRIANRTKVRAERLVEDLSRFAAGKGCRISVHEEMDGDVLDGAAFLVNSTSLGMKGQPMLDIDLAALPVEAVVNDIVYNPLKTDLLKQAEMRGNQAVDGIGMLLHQAVPGFELWFGRKPKVTEGLRNHVLEVLQN